jgi:hypothetical protein
LAAESESTELARLTAFGEVNCDAHFTLCQRFSILSYPTIKLIRKSRVWEYVSARNVPELLHFVSAEHPMSESTPLLNSRDKNIQQDFVAKHTELIPLNDENFDETIANGNWFIQFYTPT